MYAYRQLCCFPLSLRVAHLSHSAVCAPLHIYIIGDYNPSVRIIDLVSHITYILCVNFIHKWRDLQFKADTERQIF